MIVWMGGRGITLLRGITRVEGRFVEVLQLLMNVIEVFCMLLKTRERYNFMPSGSGISATFSYFIDPSSKAIHLDRIPRIEL